MPMDIARQGVQRLMTDGAHIVEVLPTEEYANEHLRGALTLPLDNFTRESVERLLRRDRPVVLYCQNSQ